MIEKIYLGLILLFFILAFAIRNIKTFLSTKQPIRGNSTKLTISIISSTVIYILILSRLIFIKSQWILELDIPENFVIKLIGLILITSGFIIGIFALLAMRNSWRVGIKYDQKTELVTSGIYRISRNPYFFSYDILILGYILIFPSIILIILYIILVMAFHQMILEEERYLKLVHGSSYMDYKKKVNRYMTLK